LAAACNQEQTPPELTGTVNISGTMKVGEEVTAVPVDSNGTPGKFRYQWTRIPDGGTALEIYGANGATYVIAEADVDHTLGAILTNDDTIGPIFGESSAKVEIPNPAITEFPVSFDFLNPVDPDFRYDVAIQDVRTAAGSATLQDIKVGGKDIVTIIEEAIIGAFDGAAGPARGRFRKRVRSGGWSHNIRGQFCNHIQAKSDG
jgi:hypothetical protein